MPATWGAAMEVPWLGTTAVSEAMPALRISSPGAATRTRGPKFEKVESCWFLLTLATFRRHLERVPAGGQGRQAMQAVSNLYEWLRGPDHSTQLSQLGIQTNAAVTAAMSCSR